MGIAKPPNQKEDESKTNKEEIKTEEMQEEKKDVPNVIKNSNPFGIKAPEKQADKFRKPKVRFEEAKADEKEELQKKFKSELS